MERREDRDAGSFSSDFIRGGVRETLPIKSAPRLIDRPILSLRLFLIAGEVCCRRGLFLLGGVFGCRWSTPSSQLKEFLNTAWSDSLVLRRMQ